ncbi:MAG: hypothetical protein K1X78_23720 [Verrucomicrobiaceae bacterium]|nr:hypothetical protein [Verrucomicrobiaceae bacterium]
MSATLAQRSRPLRVAALCLASCWSLAAPAWAADPTGVQQYWLELMNRMRISPAAELERLTNYSVPGTTFASPASDDPFVNAALQFYQTSASTLATQWAGLIPAPALAWNGSLSDSAATYSNVMVALDTQAHNLDGLTLEDRILNGGYTVNYLELGESLFATAQNAFHGHAAFAIDWGDSDSNPGNGFGTGIQTPASHRDDLMLPSFKEVGIGFQTSSLVGNVNVTGPLVTTQHFASQFRVVGLTYVADAFLTGSIYTDAVLADNFYTPGEGVAGATVNVYNDATNTLVKTGASNSAGGFNILLDGLATGTLYRIEAPGTGQPAQTFSLSTRTVFYQAANPGDPDVPVTYYDNVYASFQAVPEPGGAVLILAAALAGYVRRGKARGRSAPSHAFSLSCAP